MRERVMAERRRLAKNHVDGLPGEFVDDVKPLLEIQRGIHLGVNAKGERLTGQERKVLERTRDALTSKLSGEYANGTRKGLDDFMREKLIHYQEVKEEIVSRSK